jgi:hypothetical protein
MARTKDEWFTLIRADLARNRAFVPLDETDMEAALSETLDLWNQYLPVYEFRSIRVPNGLVIVDLAGEPDIHGVGDFHYTDSTVDINRTLTPFYPIQIMSMSLQGPRFQFEVNQTIERWAQLLGGKEDQFWEPTLRRLFVWNPRGQTNFTFAVMKDTDLDKIGTHRYNIFRKLLRSNARLQMIQAFERLGPLPGPEGNIETDMDDQKERSKLEMEEVIPVLERMPEAMVNPRWD